MRIEERVDVTDRLRDNTGAASTYVIKPSVVREMAGSFENVFQTLQVFPGAVGINDDDGKLAVRGAGPEHNLIVVDGVQIHRPQRLGHFTASLLNNETIDRISLDASGLDARYGGRLSSVTTIETRDGVRDRALAISGSMASPAATCCSRDACRTPRLDRGGPRRAVLTTARCSIDSTARGVSWYTGRRYAFDGRPAPYARFGFARLNERELPEAVRRMAAALKV